MTQPDETLTASDELFMVIAGEFMAGYWRTLDAAVTGGVSTPPPRGIRVVLGDPEETREGER